MTKWESYFIDVAYRTAELSSCRRRKVGALIVKDKRIVSIGYNGTPTGLKKEVEETCGWCNGSGGNIEICPKCGGIGKVYEQIPDNDCETEIIICPECSANMTKLDDIQYICNNCKHITKSPIRKLVTRDDVIHAEQNALMFCAKNGISTDGCDMYVTASPCINCAKLIIQAGIKKVYYAEEYRKTDGIELLEKAGIDCIKIKRNP